MGCMPTDTAKAGGMATRITRSAGPVAWGTRKTSRTQRKGGERGSKRVRTRRDLGSKLRLPCHVWRPEQAETRAFILSGLTKVTGRSIIATSHMSAHVPHCELEPVRHRSAKAGGRVRRQAAAPRPTCCRKVMVTRFIFTGLIACWTSFATRSSKRTTDRRGTGSE